MKTGERAAIFLAPSSQQQLMGGKWMGKKKKNEWQCQSRGVAELKSKRQMIKNKAPNYSSRISTDIPLYESAGASFDRYLEDKPRVFRAMFPDKRRSKQLNQEEWRIEMLPINFLFLTVWPVVDMRLRCKTDAKDYPPQIPQCVTKVLELIITRWQLQGLDNVLEPSQFSLGVKGALYAERLGLRTRLKGQLEMNLSFVHPPVLAMIPKEVRKKVAESVLAGLLQNMKHKVNGSLLADYSEFKRERLKKNLV